MKAEVNISCDITMTVDLDITEDEYKESPQWKKLEIIFDSLNEDELKEELLTSFYIDEVEFLEEEDDE